MFTLVLAQLLRDHFAVPSYLFGGLVVYALANTLIPALVFGPPPQDFGDPKPPADPGRSASSRAGVGGVAGPSSPAGAGGKTADTLEA